MYHYLISVNPFYFTFPSYLLLEYFLFFYHFPVLSLVIDSSAILSKHPTEIIGHILELY